MDTNESLLFLRANVRPIIEPLFVELLRNRPEDIIDYSLAYFQKLLNDGNRPFETEADN